MEIEKITSKDGTPIAVYRSGTGPPLLLVETRVVVADPLLDAHVNRLARHLRHQTVNPHVDHLITYVWREKLGFWAYLVSRDREGFRGRSRYLPLLEWDLSHPEEPCALVSKNVAEVRPFLGVEENHVLRHPLARHLGSSPDVKLRRGPEVDPLPRDPFHPLSDVGDRQTQPVLVRQVIQLHLLGLQRYSEPSGIRPADQHRRRRKDR